MLIDSHCHLSFKDYQPDEIDALLTRARDAGVGGFINIGAGEGEEGNIQALALAKKYPQMFTTVGIHPHDAKIVTDDLMERLSQLATDPKVVAIGEIGLDFFYEHSPREPQEKTFRRFIELAHQLNKPIMIHDRGAGDLTYEILREMGLGQKGCMIHCFTGTPDLAQKYLELGCHLSFTGIITFKKSEELRQVVKTTPLSKILIETDSPYLTPDPHRGKRNEPALVRLVAEKIAQVKGIAFEEVAQATTQNAQKFFGITGV